MCLHTLLACYACQLTHQFGWRDSEVFLRCVFLHLCPWFADGAHLLGRMKISTSFVGPFARGTHFLFQHIQGRVKEHYLYVVVILLCDSG